MIVYKIMNNGTKKYHIPTELEELEILDKYVNKYYTQNELLKEYNCSIYKFRLILKKNNLYKKIKNRINPRFTKEQELEIVNKYQTNYGGIRKLSKEYGCSKSFINLILQKYGIKCKTNFTPELIQKIINLYNNELKTTREIQKILNINRYLITSILAQNNITIRQGKGPTRETYLENKNPNWSGGRHLDRQGYVEILNPQRIAGNKEKIYVKEHRYIMEQYLGEKLGINDHVHHINGIKTDNRLDNLIVKKSSDHYGNVDCPRCKLHFRIR